MIIEWTDPPTDALDQLPGWMRELGLVDVTLSLTGAHIANLPPLDRSIDPHPYLRRHLGPKIPVIVVTGAPVAGKTGVLEILSRDPRLHVVPEAATIFIKQIGIDPFGEEGHSERFQMALRNMQMTFEALACSQARSMGKKAVIVDRGTLDSCAYMKRGRSGFNQHFGIEALNEELRYHGVVQLAVTSEAIYEKYRHNNAARRPDETYAKACLIDQSLKQAWKGHSNYTYVDESDWDTKVQRVIDFVNAQIS